MLAFLSILSISKRCGIIKTCPNFKRYCPDEIKIKRVVCSPIGKIDEGVISNKIISKDSKKITLPEEIDEDIPSKKIKFRPHCFKHDNEWICGIKQGEKISNMKLGCYYDIKGNIQCPPFHHRPGFKGK